MRRLCLSLLVAGCTVEGGKDVPLVSSGSSGVTVDPATQKVQIDANTVPVLPSCGAGQVVRRSASGWECAPIDWSTLAGKPATFPPDTHAHVDLANRITTLEGRANGFDDALQGLGGTVATSEVTFSGASSALALTAESASDGQALALRSSSRDSFVLGFTVHAEGTDPKKHYAQISALDSGSEPRQLLLGPGDVFGAARDPSGTALKICSGRTTRYSTAWIQYGTNGIYVNVDTSGCKFTQIPIYLTALNGDTSHWTSTGGSEVYSPAVSGFTIYIDAKQAMSPATANSWGWHVTWVAFGR